MMPSTESPSARAKATSRRNQVERAAIVREIVAEARPSGDQISAAELLARIWGPLPGSLVSEAERGEA